MRRVNVTTRVIKLCCTARGEGGGAGYRDRSQLSQAQGSTILSRGPYREGNMRSASRKVTRRLWEHFTEVNEKRNPPSSPARPETCF